VSTLFNYVQKSIKIKLKINNNCSWRTAMNDLIKYEEDFKIIINIIETAKERAYRKVNEELILMYRDIGKYISKQTEKVQYGDAFVQNLAGFLRKTTPNLKVSIVVDFIE
jgi:hypothetical protein